MSEAIEALRRETGIFIQRLGGIHYSVVKGIEYIATDAEVKLWAALLAERERNRKLVEALEYIRDLCREVSIVEVVDKTEKCTWLYISSVADVALLVGKE